MKNQLYILFINIIGLSLLLSSCDDFLDNKPKGDIIPAKTSDYSKMFSSSSMISLTDQIMVLMTDDVHVYFRDPSGRVMDYNSYDYMSRVCKNLYTFEDDVFGETDSEYTMSSGYGSLYTYNVVIDQVMNSEGGTQREKEILLGEALVGRAFIYMELINMYSRAYDKETAAKALGVPLELKPEETDFLKDRVRPSLQENCDQIEKDLLDAIDLLNIKPTTTAYRASIPAAYGLLARFYLYTGNYSEALKYSELCLSHNSSLLNLNDYEVVDDASQWYRINMPADGVDNKESVYLKYGFYKTGPSLYGALYPSDELVNLYNKTNDKRFPLYYSYTYGEVTTDRPVWAPLININIGVGTPEQYLIAAECAAREGDNTKALNYLNELRKHRLITYEAFEATDSEIILREVLDERRRELAFYGAFRVFDLKRLNKDPRFAKDIIHKLEKLDNEGNVVGEEVYKLEANSYKYSLPIPREVLRFNPDMQERDMD